MITLWHNTLISDHPWHPHSPQKAMYSCCTLRQSTHAVHSKHEACMICTMPGLADGIRPSVYSQASKHAHTTHASIPLPLEHGAPLAWPARPPLCHQPGSRGEAHTLRVGTGVVAESLAACHWPPGECRRCCNSCGSDGTHGGLGGSMDRGRGGGGACGVGGGHAVRDAGHAVCMGGACGVSHLPACLFGLAAFSLLTVN